ncbi:MAG TPA: hypothetical protein P5056_03720, partial [Candidatus Paceibacterota bacterium]|nr:hypothetical protein [Candidatus Paceibacterota bacterium]
MNKIKADGEDLKVYSNALDAEKSKVIADSAQKVCAKMLPQLEAAKTEISRNDIVILQNNLDKCSGKTTEECKMINQLAGKFNEFNGAAKKFSSEIDTARNFCSNPSEASFEKIAESLQGIKEDGEDLRILGKELQADQAEKASEKALCRAIVPLFATGKSELAAGLAKVKATQDSCSGSKDEKCASIRALAPKFSEVSTKGNELLTGMTSVETTCKTPSDKAPSADFIKKIEGIRNSKDAVLKLVEALRAEQDKAATSGKGIRVEAEEEVSTNLLPKTESWHSRKELNPSWRPPFFGAGVWYLSRGGESLSYNVNVPTAGDYSLWVRDYVDNFQPKGVRRVTYTINGKSLGTYPEVALAGSKIDAGKGAFGWHKVFVTKLNAGPNMMKVTKESTTSGAAILDAFYFTTGSDVPPEK